MRLLGWTIVGLAVLSLAATIAAQLIALSPGEIERAETRGPPPVAVKIADTKKTEEPPPPEPKSQQSLLAELAPNSFSSSMSNLAGVGFGSGGPSVGGGGGFGTTGDDLVKKQTSIDRQPRALVKSPPEYPPEARQKSISGYVVLKIQIDPNGGVIEAKVEESEPKGFFDQAALKAIRSWRFEPAVSQGRSVAAWTSQRIKFELN